MANLKKRPETKAKKSLYGHDLSKRILFTSSVGQLLPVLYDFLNPGEKIKINRDCYTRTQPLKTPAFIRLTEHVDYFFVPMKQICSYFGNAFYGISDFSNPNDSLSTTNWKSPLAAPTCTTNDIRSSLFTKTTTASGGVFSTHFDEFGVPVQSNIIRLLSLLGYSENFVQNLTPASDTSLPALNLNLLAVYQKIFADYYRLSDWTVNNPYNYSLNQYYKAGNYSSAFAGINNTYGEGLFKLRYRPLKKDFFTNVFPSPLFSQGVSINGYTGQSLTSQENFSKKNSMILSTYGVNMQWPFDYGGYGGVSDGGNAQMDDVIYPNSGDDNGMDYPVTVSGLRTLFAYDRMQRITQRAGKHYDKQTLAHFGYSVPKGVSDEVYYLGSHSSVIRIGEIAATATTGTGEGSSTLGELAGRGASMGTKNKDISFVAPYHGYLMAIYSCVPDVDYAASGIDRLNTYVGINDYYHPAFDNIGMVPMYKFEFLYNSTYGSVPTESTPVITSDIIGWNYRYYELKMKYDSVHGAFNYNLKNWACTRNNTFLQDNNSPVFSQAGFYCSPRYLDNVFEWSFVNSDDAVTGKVKVMTEFKDLSNKSIYSVAPTFMYDPLLHCIDFKYYKSSYMSPYGIPRI